MKAIERLYKYIDYKGYKPTRFEKELGLSNGYLGTQYKRSADLGESVFNKIIDYCLDINPEWLLTGHGTMLKSPTYGDVVAAIRNKVKVSCPGINPEWLLTGKGEPKLSDEKPVTIKKVDMKNNPTDGIPLIPVSAFAGFGKGEMQIMEYDCERYVVPMFKEAEFLIQVKGSSMTPKYNSGDLVACKKIPLNDIFFQWNKVYVLDTVQGALVKRIKKGSDSEHILIVSDNEKYEPFELSTNQINGIAIVVGVLRLE